ncbi:MAG: hypothetical protein K8H88_14150 [Sandaracinaceae bacterium]|nr:hypothetical protein [Sandaracinaceae bacterium]
MTDEDEWARRIETYLDLGSGGVLLLVDRAHDVHLGTLVRRLLPKHPSLEIVVAPDELHEVEPGSAVVFVLRREHAEALNRLRPIVKDRDLRVVLWSPAAVTAELPLRAPDFYDWISHRVECAPSTAPRFAVLGLLAAERAGRPVRWEGGAPLLRRAVAGAWPDVRIWTNEWWYGYGGLVDELRRSSGDFSVLEMSYETGPRALRWALAEAHRRERVAIQVEGHYPIELSGFWRLSAARLRLAGLRRGPARLSACVLDLERDALELLRRATPESLETWKEQLARETDQAASLAAHVEPVPWEAVATGEAPAPFLRAFGADPELGRRVREIPGWEKDERLQAALVVLEREAAPLPPPGDAPLSALQIERALWQPDPPRERLVASASELEEYEVATHWAGFSPLHVEAALVGVPRERAERTFARARVGATEPDPPWLVSLRLRVSADYGDLTVVREAVERGPERIESPQLAYFRALLGDWMGARDALRAHPAQGLGPLGKSALAFAAWACDSAALVAERLDVTGVSPDRREAAVWLRWLPVLGLLRSEELRSAEPTEYEHVWIGTVEGGMSQLAQACSALIREEAGECVRASATGIDVLERDLGPAEHHLEGILNWVQGRALARLAQPDRALDRFDRAVSILRRTTGNEAHPWILLARFEHAWIRAAQRGGDVAEVEAHLEALRATLWPEHRELKNAEAMRARLHRGPGAHSVGSRRR